MMYSIPSVFLKESVEYVRDNARQGIHNQELMDDAERRTVASAKSISS